MMPFNYKALLCFMALIFASCATSTLPTDETVHLSKATSAPLCENATAELRIDFPTARVNDCSTTSSDSFSLIIRPEKTIDPQGAVINNSPWYGFRIDPKQEGVVNIELVYENGTHRYQPKLSYDGVNWVFLPKTETPKPRPSKFLFRIKTDDRPFYISAQEIFTPKAHDVWTAKMADKPFVSQSVIGTSRNGYPLNMLKVQTEPGVKKPYVVWVGRQHPPEVTGALALIPFSETVLNNSELSKTFLKHFDVLIIPMMNPDGAASGYWRFNNGGMDLNRDWGPFSQAETRAVRDAFRIFETGQDEIAFFLDFHSTWRNLLYTQADDEPTKPPMFARDWLKAVDARLDDKIYPFTREARHNSGKPISKNYMYDTYGISAITYEVGDATPRSAIDSSAKVFAEEMMKLLLVHESKK